MKNITHIALAAFVFAVIGAATTAPAAAYIKFDGVDGESKFHQMQYEVQYDEEDTPQPIGGGFNRDIIRRRV